MASRAGSELLLISSNTKLQLTALSYKDFLFSFPSFPAIDYSHNTNNCCDYYPKKCQEQA
jgi:hypothetical protein